MFNGLARWVKKGNNNGIWMINPFHLTCEQLKQINTRGIKKTEKDQYLIEIKYTTEYPWGHIQEYIGEVAGFPSHKEHEIMIYYYVPSSYTKNQQIKWLQKHTYPFPLETEE